MMAIPCWVTGENFTHKTFINRYGLQDINRNHYITPDYNFIFDFTLFDQKKLVIFCRKNFIIHFSLENDFQTLFLMVDDFLRKQHLKTKVY